MNDKHHLADLQLAIMQVLWDRGSATVAEVRDALEATGRSLAYTTISTMLTKMERNGQVRHRSRGRVLVYRASLRQERVEQSMVSDLARRLFAGDVTEMVNRLLDGCEVSGDELARLKTLIRDRERESDNAD